MSTLWPTRATREERVSMKLLEAFAHALSVTQAISWHTLKLALIKWRLNWCSENKRQLSTNNDLIWWQVSLFVDIILSLLMRTYLRYLLLTRVLLRTPITQMIFFNQGIFAIVEIRHPWKYNKAPRDNWQNRMLGKWVWQRLGGHAMRGAAEDALAR